MPEDMSFYKLTSERWADLEALFGPKGACAGCWCMWYRLKRADFESQKGEGNKQSMKKIVDSGLSPGILGYENQKPVAWCSIAPREEFSLLSRSPILKPLDDKPVWSIVCIFIAKSHRKKGITEKMVRAVVDYAKDNGAIIVESYPVDPVKEKYPEVFAGTGFYSTFKKLGFEESVRRSKTRPLMRYYLK